MAALLLITSMPKFQGFSPSSFEGVFNQMSSLFANSVLNPQEIYRIFLENSPSLSEGVFPSEAAIEKVAFGAMFFAGLAILIHHDSLKLSQKNELALAKNLNSLDLTARSQIEIKGSQGPIERKEPRRKSFRKIRSEAKALTKRIEASEKRNSSSLSQPSKLSQKQIRIKFHAGKAKGSVISELPVNGASEAIKPIAAHIFQKKEPKFIRAEIALLEKAKPPQAPLEEKKEPILLEEAKPEVQSSSFFEQPIIEKPSLEAPKEEVADKLEELPQAEKITPQKNLPLPLLLLSSLYNTWAGKADSSPSVERAPKKEKRDPIRAQFPKNLNQKRSMPAFRYQAGKR